MLRFSLIALFALSILSLSPDNASADGRDPHSRAAAQNGWRTSLRAAKDEARKVGKPILAVLRCFP